MRLVSIFTGATCALAFAGHQAGAADLGGYYPRGGYGGGSIKDSGPAYVPVASGSNPCYVRADLGYGYANAPKLRRTTTHDVTVTDPDTGDETTTTVSSSHVGSPKMGDGWVTDLGVGCGRGDRGLRGEIVLGLRGNRDLSGVDAAYGAFTSSVTSHTGMFNLYYDFGNFGGFVPYVGAGVGASYNQMDTISFARGGTMSGADKVSLAWSLMAGVGYKLSERLTLDMGYRYIDLGKATGGEVVRTACGSTCVEDALKTDKLSAHELKLGVRFYPHM